MQKELLSEVFVLSAVMATLDTLEEGKTPEIICEDELQTEVLLNTILTTRKFIKSLQEKKVLSEILELYREKCKVAEEFYEEFGVRWPL